MFFLILFLLIWKNDAFPNEENIDEDIPSSISVEPLKNHNFICFGDNNTVCRTDNEILNCVVEAPMCWFFLGMFLCKLQQRQRRSRTWKLLL